MQKRELVNRIRSLFNIDGHLLPELTAPQQLQFLRDPVRYFLDSDEAQSDAIMREIESRQPSSAAAPKTASRASRGKAKVEGQRELLLPIPGGKISEKQTTASAGDARNDRENVSIRRSR
jgi:hypothetical protein